MLQPILDLSLITHAVVDKEHCLSVIICVCERRCASTLFVCIVLVLWCVYAPCMQTCLCGVRASVYLCICVCLCVQKIYARRKSVLRTSTSTVRAITFTARVHILLTHKFTVHANKTKDRMFHPNESQQKHLVAQ